MHLDSSYDLAYEATNPTFKGPMLESLAEEGSMFQIEGGSMVNNEEHASSEVTRSQVDFTMENEANKEQARKTSVASTAMSDFSVPGSITDAGIH